MCVPYSLKMSHHHQPAQTKADRFCSRLRKRWTVCLSKWSPKPLPCTERLKGPGGSEASGAFTAKSQGGLDRSVCPRWKQSPESRELWLQLKETERKSRYLFLMVELNLTWVLYKGSPPPSTNPRSHHAKRQQRFEAACKSRVLFFFMTD